MSGFRGKEERLAFQRICHIQAFPCLLEIGGASSQHQDGADHQRQGILCQQLGFLSTNNNETSTMSCCCSSCTCQWAYI
ncbi:hypothetical protein CesoFtcFv8_008094 [Champsocephalus esox]|uniref:Uncharacterized protein n=1 Tax=Champsocephalus esox TaxID=159716 RepID=A0AAN8CI64_9TELE|nr:hypothetical protein CesoFtcFv8_008094 [Champsocephalus esox]